MKKIAQSVFLLLLTLGLHFLVSPYFYRPVLATRPILRQFEKLMSASADVIYLTDSTNNYPVRKDAEKTSIDGYLREMLPREISLKTLTGAGFNLSVYADLCHRIARSPRPPRVIVLPINMRAFGVAWDRAPMYQFGVERLALRRPYLLPFYKILSRLGFNFDGISHEAFMNTEVMDGQKNLGDFRQFRIRKPWQKFFHQNQQNIILTSYMVELRADHRKIRALLRLKKDLDDAGIGLLVYLTPIDHLVCARHYPRRFYPSLEKNLSLLEDLLRTAEIEYIDMSRDLDSSAFGWRGQIYINEHLNHRGRRHVASKLSTALMEILSP